MKGKKSFTAYCDWIDTFEALDDEQAGKLVKHLFRYVNDQDPEPENPLIKAVFAGLKSTLKRDLRKWIEKAAKNRENAYKRWNKDNAIETQSMRTHANASERIRSDANNAVRDSVSDSVSVSVREVKKESVKKSRFAPPTLSEVEDYIFENGYWVNASNFINYYESKGWMIGKNKMKDWKAAVRTWQSREKEKSSAKKENPNGLDILREINKANGI